MPHAPLLFPRPRCRSDLTAALSLWLQPDAKARGVGAESCKISFRKFPLLVPQKTDDAVHAANTDYPWRDGPKHIAPLLPVKTGDSPATVAAAAFHGPMTVLAPPTPGLACTEAVEASGATEANAIFSSLKTSGTVNLPDVNIANGTVDAMPAIATAVNISYICGAGTLHLPPAGAGGYLLNSTLNIVRGFAPHLTISGSQGARAFLSYGAGTRFSPLITIGGPSPVGKQTASGITLQDLSMHSGETGVMMYSVARIRLLRVFIDVEVHTGSSNNCAVLVVDAYWIQMEQSQFTGPSRIKGDLPVVILRGDEFGVVATTYLVRMSELVINYGGIRYEQRVNIPSEKDQYTSSESRGPATPVQPCPAVCSDKALRGRR